jgi:chemotaxis protein methyltransferase CheR
MNYDFDLSEVEYRMLRDYIHDQSGIYLKDEKHSYLRMKLYPRVVSLGLNSFSAYLQNLKYGPDRLAEWSRMIALVTNNETYFFRETPQLMIFHDHLLPELRETKQEGKDRTIRVLSAGCSTGEEAYTLALLAFNTGSFFWGWDLRIVGLDINDNALCAARQGEYYERSFRMMDQQYLRFFNPNNGHFEVKDSIKRFVEFRRGNISEPGSLRELGTFDIIFCRNVLIYFSEDKLKAAVDNFHSVLNDGGYLLLGHSETLTTVETDFKPRRFPESIIYRK